MMTNLFAALFHIDTFIPQIMSQSGILVYLFIFTIIFIETGIVILPFLPGDSLLFLMGSLAALSQKALNPFLLIVILGSAATLGDGLNFEIGKRFGKHLSTSHRWRKVIKPKHLKQAEVFFKEKGNIAIFLGRFMPIIRTLVPFTAGGSKMPYHSFVIYNVLGGFSWVALCIGAGYFFGNVPIVKSHFTLIMLAIVLISLIPIGIISWRNYILQKKAL